LATRQETFVVATNGASLKSDIGKDAMRKIIFALELGQSNLEIALLLLMVIVVAVLALPILGVNLNAIYCQVASGLGTVSAEGCMVGNQVLFSDDFAKTSGVWNFLTGNWQLCNGKLCALNGAENRAFANNAKCTDCTISVDSLLDKGNGYGIFFRTSGGANFNGYDFQYDPGYSGGQFIMRKWVNGTEIWPPFAATAAPPNYQWTGVERHVEVTTKGNVFTAKIDGKVVLTGQDSTYTSGQTGLRVWSPGQASFDNFKVTTP
jgi:hypothetical protein